MNTITRNAVRQHLEATRENLTHANNVPVCFALRFLEEASDQLSAAIDTIKQAQDDTPTEHIDLTTIGRAEGRAAMAEA